MMMSIGTNCNCSKFSAHMPRMKPNRQKLTAITIMKASIASGWATRTSTKRCAVAKITSPTIIDFVAAAPT